MTKRIVSSLVAVTFIAVTISLSSMAAILEPITTTGHDQDIVFEAGLSDGQIGANGEFGSRQFFEAGVFADGLPQGVTNFVSILTSDTITFAFQPFSQNNILKFDNAAPVKTLTLSTPAPYNQLAVVHSGGSLAIPAEVAILTYTINYTGGQTEIGSVNSVDWGAVPTLPAGTERLLVADRTTANATTWPVSSDNNTTANRWAIYLTEITPTRPDLNIESISFGPVALSNTTTMAVAALNAGDDVVVFGLSGELANVIVEPPVITNQPVNITVMERQSATFSVGATGFPLAFHWLRDGAPIPGARSASYSIPATVLADNGAQFQVIVSNSMGVATSSVATLTVLGDDTPPAIISAIGELDPTRVRLVFSEPLDPNTVNQSNFEIFLTGTTPSGLYATFGTMLTNNGTVVELITDPRVAGENYSIQILDVRDASSGNNSISPNPLVVPIWPTIQLIGFDTENEWKYDINNGDRTGTGWEAPGFDDSSWPSGPAGLGRDVAGNGVPIRTDIPYMTNGVVTYFRRHFTLPAATNNVVLTLRDVLEDGAVYYLNGREVFRNRMPAGPVTFATLATGAPDPTPIAGPFNIAATNLVSGDNVLAVEVHQSATNSTDVELAVELLARISSFSVPAPRIDFVHNANGTVTLTWNAPGFCLQEASVLSGPTTVWSPSTVVSSAPFTPTGTAKFYRLSNGCN